MKKTLQAGAALTAAALALTLTACGNNEPTTETSTAGTPAANTPAAEKLSGTLQGTGASSMKEAQQVWRAEFNKQQPGVTINYAPDGSGAGRKAFSEGGAAFAGSDRALKDEEIAGEKALTLANCADGGALNLPVYISPIAIIYNVPGVKDLKLDGPTTAKIFRGEIKNWNDPAIAALNAGVTLPDLAITPVHRSDNSGTTENFTDTLSKVAKDVWTDKASGDWPKELAGEAAQGTSGVVAAVKNGQGTIGYADESGVEPDMTHAKFSATGQGEFYGPTAEAAAKIVNASKRVEGRADNDYALKLDRTAAGYPFVLISYMIVCQNYKDASVGKLVQAYTDFVVSDAAQNASVKQAGNAPLSGELATGVRKAAKTIK